MHSAWYKAARVGVDINSPSSNSVREGAGEAEKEGKADEGGRGVEDDDKKVEEEEEEDE